MMDNSAKNDGKVSAPISSSRPRLSLCMIVRDNAPIIKACLESIRPWVDEIIVVDTGSVDETPEICRSLGAKLFSFPWIDDFSAARNESLRRATGEWIFWMDSDDTIDEKNGRALRLLADSDHGASVMGYVLQVYCPGPDDELTVVDHVKLVRNHPAIRFEGRIHEQLIGGIRALGGEIGWTDIHVIHSGSDLTPQVKHKKVERDLRLLRKDIEERPGHSFVMFNLGMTYHECEEYGEAVQWLQKSLAASRPHESHVRKIFALLVSSLTNLGRFDEAQDVCMAGQRQFPSDVELSFRQGILAHKGGRLQESIAAYRRALTRREPRHFSSIDPGIKSFKTRHNLALVLEDQGSHDLAELEWRKVVDERPNFVPGIRGLGKVLLARRRFAAAEVQLDRWSLSPDMLHEQLMLGAELQKQKGQYGEARARLEEGARLFPTDTAIRHSLCQFLYHHGTPEEALRALIDLLELAPEDAVAWYNMGLLHSSQGRHSEAVKAFQQSLRYRPENATTKQALLAALANIPGSVSQDVNTGLLRDSADCLPDTEAHFGLAPCHSRRAFDPSQQSFFCAHPGVGAFDGMVSPALCKICRQSAEPAPIRFRDRSEAPRRPRAQPCSFLGKETGLRECPTCHGKVKLKVFDCHHPKHPETTISECQRCPDYGSAVVPPLLQVTCNDTSQITNAHHLMR